tara:strand:- start:159 stop:662 length:504 start_codon:yes stop_codon:yes gene_type:complete
MVIWITGLSASGKTTLAKTFFENYKNKIPNLVLLDGDIIRDLFGNNLGYTVEDRIKQINRLQKLSLFLERQSLVVVVAVLYSDNNLLAENRDIFNDYIEIYLKGTIEQLKKREFKNLYKRALAGTIKDVVGVDIPWIEPENPDIIFNLSENLSSDEMSKILFKKLNY